MDAKVGLCPTIGYYKLDSITKAPGPYASNQDAEDAAWEEIEQALRQFEKGQQFEGPCEMLIAVGTR